MSGDITGVSLSAYALAPSHVAWFVSCVEEHASQIMGGF